MGGEAGEEGSGFESGEGEDGGGSHSLKPGEAGGSGFEQSGGGKGDEAEESQPQKQVFEREGVGDDDQDGGEANQQYEENDVNQSQAFESKK